MASRFFGLSDEYIKSVYEQMFFLKYYGGWGFLEAYNLPIVIRNWFAERLLKQLKEEEESYQKAAKKK